MSGARGIGGLELGEAFFSWAKGSQEPNQGFIAWHSIAFYSRYFSYHLNFLRIKLLN